MIFVEDITTTVVLEKQPTFIVGIGCTMIYRNIYEMRAGSSDNALFNVTLQITDLA